MLLLAKDVLHKLWVLLSRGRESKKVKASAGKEIQNLKAAVQKILLYSTIFAEELAVLSKRMSGEKEEESPPKPKEEQEGKAENNDEAGGQERNIQGDAQPDEIPSEPVLRSLPPEKILSIFDKKFPAEGTPRLFISLSHSFHHSGRRFGDDGCDAFDCD